MNEFLLLPSVFSFFAADPAGPVITLPGIADDQLMPINTDFSEQLALIPDVDIELTKLDEDFRFFWGHVTDPVLLRRRAGEWLLSQRLTFEIPRQRLSTLKKQFDVERPPPYDHPALSDLSISSDRLVPIHEFDVRGGILIRKGYAFSVLPPIESPNAQYWLMKVASLSEFADYLWVRLDPFLWGPEETFPQMAYLMLWYGKSLDWDRIRNLRSVEHGRWLPEKFSCRSEFTDYTWMPREHEIHFQCEELPVRNSTEARGSRYLHAIYIPDRDAIVHLDGAVRIYSSDEWDIRREHHVRNAGKAGLRVKVFRVDHEITRDALSQICPQFFVWNYDVARYFGTAIPEAAR